MLFVEVTNDSPQQSASKSSHVRWQMWTHIRLSQCLSLWCASFCLVAALIMPTPLSAATISWETWILGAPNTVGTTTYGSASGTALPHQLHAGAGVSTHVLDPRSWGTEQATTSISLSNHFTVLGGPDDTGKQIDGRLFGSLSGVLQAFGVSVGSLTGSYSASVEASVNADFASWSSPGLGHSISGSVFLVDLLSLPVADSFSIPGNVTIGNRYAFAMSLTVHADKVGAYSALSDFRSSLVAGVSVPEPCTVALLLVGVIGLLLLLFCYRIVCPGQ